ncbi:transcription factor IIIB 90 kDa subunit-like isoform X2 [Corticium candelabrum]|uniref:transcription factor IIIB 90 kDa subunit-like isoform X2 n=1 Tax=Corticium candelabrum TaxID=121492 RepID=UPI002E26E407|nr:transcription factor IIIB 90 kDa subunit-like isoform X2 [Corticium candelabrum]
MEDMESKISRLLEADAAISEPHLTESDISNEDAITKSHSIGITTSKQVSFAPEVDVDDHSHTDDTIRSDDVESTLKNTARRGILAVRAAGGYDVVAAALGNEITEVPGVVDSLADSEPTESMLVEDESDVWDDLDDAELNKFLLSEEEVTVKTKLWMEENKIYLEQQQAKKEQEEQEKLKNKDKPAKKTRRRKPKVATQPCKTAGEAIERMLQEKRISSKINYEVLRDLNSLARACSEVSTHELPLSESVQFGDECGNSLLKSHLQLPESSQEPPAKKKTLRADGTVQKAQGATVADSVIVIESGPVEYATEDIVDEEYDDEEADVSTATINDVNHHQGYYEDYDDYETVEDWS